MTKPKINYTFFNILINSIHSCNPIKKFRISRLWIAFLLYITLPIAINAQHAPATFKLTGTVITFENEVETPVEYTTVRLLSATDSTLIAGTTSDENGRFELSTPKARDYILFISSIGYSNLYKRVSLKENIPVLKLNNIVLQENSISLAEAIVVGQRTQMVVKTDTMEYNAAAYKLQENAVVEDLLKRLPGITITEDGKILVNGKEVKTVMVDGKDFFRSNPNLSIKNIPAEIMDKLQIIDDKSELAKLTGIDDGEENTVINITILKGKKKGWLISSNIGGGQELNGNDGDIKRYTVNTFLAKLHEESQLGIVANGNNINGMNVGSGGSTTGSGKPGLNSSISGGLNFSSGDKKKKDPWVVNGDLSYGMNEMTMRRNSIRQYYLQDSTSYLTDSIEQYKKEQEIRFSAKIENRQLDNWVFSFRPSASITVTTRTDEGNSLLQAGNATRDSVNSINYNRTSTTPELNLRGIFIVTHDFAKPKRKLSLSLDSRYSNSEGTGETNALYYYNKRTADNRNVERDQQWENTSMSFTNRIYASFVEPIFEKHSLQFVYWAQTSNRSNIKNSYQPDLISGEYNILDLPYSRSIDNLAVTQQLGISYRGVLKNLVYTLGMDYNPSFIRSKSYIQEGAVSGSDSTISYFPGLNSYNYAPNAYLMYTMGKGKSLRFDYKGRSEAPTVYQLDPSRDETNPTNIKMGNPGLLPRFTHWSRMRFNSNNKEKQQSLSINIEGNYILNDIVNYTSYDDISGVKTTMPINQTGSWNANGMVMYNRPLGKNFQINNYSQLVMRNNIGFSNIGGVNGSMKTVATTLSAKEELGITFKWEMLYIISKLNYQFGTTSYNIESMLSKQTSSIGGLFNAQLNLPHSWTISSELNYRSLTSFSAEYNRSEMLWNGMVSKNFLKNKAGTISLIYNDILQQQLSINQIVSSNYVEDQQYNTLKSFVMMVFSYRLNTMGQTKKKSKQQ